VAKSSKRKGIFRFPEDRRTVVFVAAYGALASYGWFATPKNPWLLAGLVVLTSISSWIIAVITHNVIHCPVFHSRALNRLFQIWLSLSYGWPVSEYLPGHNLSHHRHLQKAADYMRTTKVRSQWNLVNLILFVPTVAGTVFKLNMAFTARVRHTRPAYFRQLLLEAACVWTVKLSLLAIDWRKALLFVIIPHVFAVWGITAVNYTQHDGCDEDHPYNHSRNFVGRVFNWFTFNNGFHGIHHDRPGLHWSLLRKFHMEKIHGHIDPRLEQPSFFWYLFKTFIFPGRRKTFDGKPYDPPALVDDPPESLLGESNAIWGLEGESQRGALEEAPAAE
jgi:fatty acid desaturase